MPSSRNNSPTLASEDASTMTSNQPGADARDVVIAAPTAAVAAASWEGPTRPSTSSGLEIMDDSDDGLPLPFGAIGMDQGEAKGMMMNYDEDKKRGSVETIEDNALPEQLPFRAIGVDEGEDDKESKKRGSVETIADDDDVGPDDPQAAELRASVDHMNAKTSFLVNELSPPTPFNTTADDSGPPSDLLPGAVVKEGGDGDNFSLKRRKDDISPKNNTHEVTQQPSVPTTSLMREEREGEPSEALAATRQDNNNTITPNNAAGGYSANQYENNANEQVPSSPTNYEHSTEEIPHIPEAYLVESSDEESEPSVPSLPPLVHAQPHLPWWKQSRLRCLFSAVCFVVILLSVALGISFSSSGKESTTPTDESSPADEKGESNVTSNVIIVERTPVPSLSTSPSWSLAPTSSSPTSGDIGNGRCDPLYNIAEFNYDGGDCCMSTCMSTDEYSCGVEQDSVGLLPQKYIGYPNCVDTAIITQQCPRDTNSCWNPLSQHSGPSMAAMSRNGAIMAVASPPQILEQDGSSQQWKPRNLPLDDISFTDGQPDPSLAVSGDGSIVALSLAVDTDVLAKGQVRTFRWNARAHTYEQIGEDIFVDAVTFGVATGGAVALSEDGSILAIGAPDSYTSVSIGYVLVFKYDFIEGWTQLDKILRRDSDSDDNFGSSLSISSDGKVIAVGAPTAKSWAGYARVYKYNETMATYTLSGHFEGDTVGETFFGNAVSLSSLGDVLAIGAHRASKGYVDIFEYSSQSQAWNRNGKLVGHEDEYFGETLALSGDGKFLVVGSTLTDTSVGTNVGSVQSYRYHNETVGWEPSLEILEGGEPFIFFGRSLSLSEEDGSTLAVGNTGNFYRDGAVGSVNIFRIVDSTTLSSTESESSASDAVAITVAIQLDDYPEQTGVSLECGGVVHASVPIGSLSRPRDFRHETFFVENQTACSFTIMDRSQDGICCAYGSGYYRIYFGENMSNQENLLAQGGQMFGGQEKVTFAASPPTNLVPLTITLGQGQYGSEDTDFFLECTDVLKTELLTESAFRSRGPVTGDTFLVPHGTSCNFTKTDSNEAGGSYNISVGDSIVAASDSIGFGDEVLFIAAPPDLRPPATILTYCCVFVQIFLDEYSYETGWRLYCDNEVLYEALPGAYPEKYPSIYETFCVYNMTSCEFRLTDDFGDGFQGQYKVGTWGDEQQIFINGEEFGPFSYNITHDFDAVCPIGDQDGEI